MDINEDWQTASYKLQLIQECFYASRHKAYMGKKILLALNHEKWLSLEEITKKVGCNIKTVRNKVNRLVDYGVVIFKESYTGKRKRGRKKYLYLIKNIKLKSDQNE